MPPSGVNTEGLVEVVTTPRGTREAGEHVVLSGFRDPARRRYRDCADRLDKRNEQDRESRLAEGGARTSVATMFVSANYFKTIGVRAGARRRIRRDRG